METGLISEDQRAIMVPDEALIEDWLRWCKDAEDASEATLTAYRKSLRVFRNWLVHIGPGLVMPETVIAFKAHLQERYKPQTINLRLSAVRSFYRWMVITGKLRVSPASEVKGAKRPNSKRHKRDALSNGEVLAVLETCDDGPIGIRDRAILVLMAYCALRTIEVHRANIGNLKTGNDRLILEVQGKGRREADEVAVIPRSQEPAIRAWVALRMVFPRHSEGDPLFVSMSNRNAGGRLSTRAIRWIVKERYRRAGVAGKRKTSHSLRHSAITNAIRHGAQPLQVKALARHGSFDTSLIYFHEEARTANPAEDLITYEGGRKE